jgi:diguanylate cyclase (GGDEF)-like protein
MNFIKLSEITTKHVKVVKDETTLAEVRDTMLQSEHAFVVVERGESFYLLSVFELTGYLLRHDVDMPLTEFSLTEPLPKVREDTYTNDVLSCLKEGTETLAVVDDKSRFVGVVLQPDLISSIDPETLIKNYRLNDLFKVKKRNRWIDKNVVLFDALHEIETKRYDAYLIVEERKPLGILTARDMLRLLKRGVDLHRSVEHYMSTPVETVSADITLEEALDFMRKRNFNRIITVDREGRLIGTLTRKELVSITYTKWMSMLNRYQRELREMNEQLEAQSREYEKIATYDALTGLYNRRKFLDLYMLEYSVMMQRGNAMAFMIIDIDHFKEINDTYGHNKGDEVLKAVAQVLTDSFRDVDIVARWGGDEFVALLPAADCKTAYKIAEERIRKRLHALDSGNIDLTVSIGICEIMRGDEMEGALERADKALYKAKESGRNRVVCAC